MLLFQICQIKVPDVSTYRRHFLIQHCQYVFQCQICPVVFEDMDCAEKMVLHIKTHHITRQKNIKGCDQDGSIIIPEEFSDEDETIKTELVKDSMVEIDIYVHIRSKKNRIFFGY